MIGAVLFDLDGTLLDTAPDLAQATNQVLVHHGYATRPLTFLRPLIAGGTHQIVTHSFAIDATHEKYPVYKQHIIQAYQQQLTQQTRLFPGMSAVLTLLDTHNIPWGIVTNKPVWLAQPLLSLIQHSYCHCLIGRESLLPIKPSPLPLLYACQLLRIANEQCIYIGDSPNDILAARRANMRSIAAAYGYLAADAQPELWQANHIIHHADELITWLTPQLS